MPVGVTSVSLIDVSFRFIRDDVAHHENDLCAWGCLRLAGGRGRIAMAENGAGRVIVRRRCYWRLVY